jgi:hypothetical protein
MSEAIKENSRGQAKSGRVGTMIVPTRTLQPIASSVAPDYQLRIKKRGSESNTP